MIFDAHTHLAMKSDVYGDFLADGQRAWGEKYVAYSEPRTHQEAVRGCDGAIVLALDAPFVGFTASNELVADYVSKDPSRLFGFASVDPNRPDAQERLRYAIRELKLCGLKLAPIYQNFCPTDDKAWDLYRIADEERIPIMWHQGTSFVHTGPLEYCNPVLLDPVARAFPNLKMIIAHLGHPWYAEAVCVVRKHFHVYADVSALGSRPWQLYNALLCACEYGITDKLMFGTDFPFFKVEETVAALKNVNAVCGGTNMPRIPERIIEEIIHRNTPELLELRL